MPSPNAVRKLKGNTEEISCSNENSQMNIIIVILVVVIVIRMSISLRFPGR